MQIGQQTFQLQGLSLIADRPPAGEPLFGNLVSQQTSKYRKIASNDPDDVSGSGPKSA